MPRRLDDRIREMCADVVRAEGTDVEPRFSDLKAALREHTGRLRKLAATKLAAARQQAPDRRSYNERRKQSESQQQASGSS
jgi:hypothetical protein